MFVAFGDGKESDQKPPRDAIQFVRLADPEGLSDSLLLSRMRFQRKYFRILFESQVFQRTPKIEVNKSNQKDFCEYCNADLPDEERLVTVYRHRRGQHFIFERVLARVCQKCGERYFSAGSVSEMEREMQNLNPSDNFVNVPVIELRLAG